MMGIHTILTILLFQYLIMEVEKAIDDAKLGKACGVDGIPIEVLKNDSSVLFLHSLFNVRFNTGKVPSM